MSNVVTLRTNDGKIIITVRDDNKDRALSEIKKQKARWEASDQFINIPLVIKFE